MHRLTRKGKAVTAGLDVGTSNMVVVARANASDRVVGMGWCTSLGMRKGIVIDVDGAAQSVRRAVEMAEESAGVRINSAYVGFSGHGVNVLSRRADISISRVGKITNGDVNHLMNLMYRVEVPAGRRVLQVVPVVFEVDGVPGTGNPVGRTASSLAVETRVITVDSQLVDQLLLCIRAAGIQVAGVTLNPLVAAPVVLNNIERELGVALVDLGGGSTAVAVFNCGILVDLAVIPVGGEHITSDLDIGVRTSLAAAEEVKRDVGLLPGERTDYIELPSVAKGASHRVRMDKVLKIIESRVLEILDLVKQKIDQLSAGQALPAGVVLIGGGARLKGLPELAARVLCLPVRLGAGEITGVDEPDSCAARGLVIYDAGRVTGRESQGLAAAAGGSRLGAKGVLELFEHLRRSYPH